MILSSTSPYALLKEFSIACDFKYNAVFRVCLNGALIQRCSIFSILTGDWFTRSYYTYYLHRKEHDIEVEKRQFSLDPNVSLKQQKNSTFLSIRESLIREKFYFGQFAKVYAREMQKFREFFGSRKFLLAKVHKMYGQFKNV